MDWVIVIVECNRFLNEIIWMDKCSANVRGLEKAGARKILDVGQAQVAVGFQGQFVRANAWVASFHS